LGFVVPGDIATPSRGRARSSRFNFIVHLEHFPIELHRRRHCEERSDEAIQNGAAALDCFASLAMTIQRHREML
jgi:hypothetical protein